MNLFANNRKRKILRLLWYLPFLRLTVENLPLTSNLFTRFIVSNILNSVKKSKNENCCTEMDYQINQSVVSDRIIRQQYDRGEKKKAKYYENQN